MNIAEWTIRNRIAVYCIVVLILIGGVLAYQQLGRLEDPEFTIKEALITTMYPGATAKEVEEEVTDKIEIAIQQLPQLKHVKSISKANVSIITAEIEDKYDKHTLPQVWDELRRKVNDVQSQLPPGAGPSIVNDDYGDVYGILLAVTGNDFSYRELYDYADTMRKELLLVPDVSKVNLWGVQQEEIHIELSYAKLAQIKLSPTTIYNSLKKYNLVSPSGELRLGDDYINIRATGKIDDIDTIGDLYVQGGISGEYVRLKDIATIKHAYQTPSTTMAWFNDEKAIIIGISPKAGGNVIQLGHNIKSKLKELELQLPLGVHINTISFQPDGVEKSIGDFVINLYESIVICVITLLIAMGFSSSMLIGASLLFTILGTFIGMDLMHVNLERISLGALIIALGMLVDNAIVINEGMLIRIQQGMDRLQAANLVVKQSMWPLLGATIIAILAFASIGLSQDKTGEYTRSLFQVIMISLFLSWIVAITLTPLFCYDFIKKPSSKVAQEAYSGPIFQFYKRILLSCLRFRVIFISSILGIFVIALVGFTHLEQSFFPLSTTPQFLVHLWLPEGTDIRRTNDELKKITKMLQDQPHVKSTATYVGSGLPRFVLTYTPEKNYSSYGIILVNVDDYRAIDELIKKTNDFANNTFVDAIVKSKKFILGPSTENPIETRFSGADANTLREISENAKQIYRTSSQLYAIQDDWRERVKVIQPTLLESQTREVGITKKDVDSAMQAFFKGDLIDYYRDKEKLIPILAIAPPNENGDITDINNIQIWSPVANQYIPFTQIANGTKTVWEDAVIQRRDRLPTITTQADVLQGNVSEAFKDIKPQIETMTIPAGYKMEFGGEHEKSSDAQKALFKNIPITIVMMVVILLLLFNNIRQTLIIILTVPLAIIGVTIGLLVTGESFGFMALLGFLSLSGMLIKNAIVLIDQINLDINQGKSPFDAIVDSSLSRMRPIILAALTTILSMLPLLQDVFFAAMAVTIMAGLAFATVLTLLFVPVLYAVFFKISK